MNGATTVYIGNTFEWTGSTSTMKKYYYASGVRVAMRTGTGNPIWLMGDHLGSTSTAANYNGTLLTDGNLRYKAWGEQRYPASGPSAIPTTYRYTGQRQEKLLGGVDGLYFYNSRWYDSSLGRFLSADTLIPQPGDVQAWDRFRIFLNNPTNHIDPSGHDPYWCGGDTSCYAYHYIQMGYGYCDSKCRNKGRQDYFFSRIVPGHGKNGSWTVEDRQYYYENREFIWRYNAQDERYRNEFTSWNSFAKHVDKLASIYSSGSSKDLFVRDFALMFAGISADIPWPRAAIEAMTWPPYDFLPERNTGLAAGYIDIRRNVNQSHHYAGMFFLGYYMDPAAATAINHRRDSNNPGDIMLGDQAINDAYIFNNYLDLGNVSPFIVSFISR